MDLNSLKKTRTPHRTLTTKLCSKIEDSLNDANSSVEDFEELLAQLVEKSATLKELDSKILILLKEQEIEAEVLGCAEYDEKIISLKVKLNRKISKTKCETVSNNSTISVTESINEFKTVKLPKLQIEKFYGEPDKFLQFWNQYDNTIHNNNTLSDVDKFSYLKSLIGGTAASAINGFALSAENYSAAIQILKDRFGRKDILVQAHLNNLLSINCVKNTFDLRGLRALFDKCKIEIRSLESLGVTSDHYSTLLCPLILKLLPSDLTLRFSREQAKNEKWTVQDLMDFLQLEIETRERVSAIHKSETRSGNVQTVTNLDKNRYNSDRAKNFPRSSFTRKNIKANIPSAVELITPVDKMSCLFCSCSDHCSETCSIPVNEKKSILKKFGKCFLCLQSFHRINECKSNKLCSVCGGKHNVTLCFKRENAKISENNRKLEPEKVEHTVANHIVHEKNKIMLQTASAELIGKNSNKVIRLIIDSASCRSFVKTEISKALSLPIKATEKLSIYTFESRSPVERTCNRVEVKIKNKTSGKIITLEALEIDNITQAILEFPDASVYNQLREKGITLSDVCCKSQNETQISLLIGADNYWKVVTGKMERLTTNLVAMDTLCGWVLLGPNEKNESSARAVTSMIIQTASIEQLWNLETLGIQDPIEVTNKEEKERAALNYFKETVCINEEGRYEIKLPRVEGFDQLNSNIDIAKQRCKTTANKLLRNKRYLDYDAVFTEWVNEKVIEDVPNSDIESPCHYLPHRAVYKEQSTTKVRPVFDASCRGRGSPSLNECLEKGPNLLEQIPPILIRFRKDRIGVISDIRKAFLQISIAKDDRNFLRFFWWREIDNQEYRIFRHRRLVFGLNCSPFVLAAVLNYHIETNSSLYPETCKILKNSFYVDNCVASVPSKEKLQQFIIESTDLLKSACFDLRGWEFTAIKHEEASSPTAVLGMLWDKNEDVLFCNIKDIDLESKEICRRQILSTVHKIFDIIGILCPTTLIPKLIIQKSWILKIGWDTPLPSEFQSEFKSWVKDLPLLSEVKIPRYLNISDSEELSLHTFCDGSKHAYSTVVYLRTMCDNDVQIQLIQAKSRVAPLRNTTIPRMELMACCIGARLASSVLQALGLDKINCFYWTDSSTALTWIKKEDHWGVFVENRVKEIRALSNREEWRHVPSAMNAADLPSRGCSIKTLVKSNWWFGPEWLKQDERNWPESKIEINEEEVFKERRKQVLQALNSNTAVERWYLGYFSKYSQILRMIAWIMRFTRNCREPTNKITGELTIEEIKAAEKGVWKIVQKESFTNEENPKGHFTFIDKEGIIRLKTKILRRNDNENFRCPILVPSTHELVERMIYDYHLRLSHAGAQIVLTNIRETFWIIRGRKTVQRVLSKCIRCKRHSAKSVDTIPCPLPEDRVRDAHAFEVTGVDVAGPLYLKGERKAWILLFTCGVYRAIHLELIESLSTNGFLLGFRRFIARRGRPRIVYSDNGTNFIGAENLLRTVDWNQIMENSSVKKIQWKFNPPTAAWWGGWWERLIQMVKKLLRRVLGRASLSYEEMFTVLCDAESTINSRPLTCLTEDSDDLSPLTPSMFIQDMKTEGVPDLDSLDKVNLSKRWRYQQKLRQDFRKRFRDEYLSLLIHRPRKHMSTTRSLNKDDMVLIEMDRKKRTDWPVGRVIELLKGKDNVVRVVKVRTEKGDLIRPVQRLFPLEVNKNDPFSEQFHKRDNTKDYETQTSRYGRKIIKPKRFD